MKKLRVGLIGCGGIAQSVHMPAYHELENVELYAFADVNESTAKAAAERYGVPYVMADYRDLIAMDELDIIDVCTPNAFHKDPTVRALKAGKHVLVEKPLAMNAAEGKAMVEAAEQSGKLLMVGLHWRFNAAAQALKRAARDGALGDVYFAEAVATRRRGIPGWGVFTQKAKSGGGCLIDIGVHILDLTMHLMGYPKAISVSGVAEAKFGARADLPKVSGGWQWDCTKFDVDDFAFAFVRFENGATLSLKVSWAGNIGDEQFNCTLWGTEGGCRLSPPALFQQAHGQLVDVMPVKLPEVRPHAEEIKAFINAVRKGLPSPVPATEALQTQQILDAIYKSAKLGKEVKVG